eukprot:2422930-Prorocentrum_lima.AAC.1
MCGDFAHTLGACFTEAHTRHFESSRHWEASVELIPDIVGTCHVCRMFRRPPPSSEATSRLTTSFNGA